ncbi:hypothetical protein AX16_010466 [Volvariella volvacea WC 439]|nr:hypothetical protein AX16_010466 [Volvariella volvacea WC 439]
MKAGPVHSWQYDEIVFNDPYQNFLNILMAHPPTPLPKAKTRPVPFHQAHPASLEASKGSVPEFTTLMIQDESERLEEGKKMIVAQHEQLRQSIQEKELERLQKLISD